MQDQTIEWIRLFIIWSPLPITLIFFYIHKLVKHSTWHAIHFISEYTTIMYMVAVAILIKMTFEISIIGYIIIYILIVLGIIIIMQWKKDTEVLFGRALRMLLRMNFLLFTVLYIIAILWYMYVMYIK